MHGRMLNQLTLYDFITGDIVLLSKLYSIIYINIHLMQTFVLIPVQAIILVCLIMPKGPMKGPFIRLKI